VHCRGRKYFIEQAEVDDTEFEELSVEGVATKLQTCFAVGSFATTVNAPQADVRANAQRISCRASIQVHRRDIIATSNFFVLQSQEHTLLKVYSQAGVLGTQNCFAGSV
jgi:hypothetical protein